MFERRLLNPEFADGGVPLTCDGFGACVAVVPKGCDVPDPPGRETCETGCNDGDPCTYDFCTDVKTCQHVVLATGIECGATSMCQSGYCCPVPPQP